jgi:hypothetical protein
MPTVQRFYVINSLKNTYEKNTYEETIFLRIGETETFNARLLMPSLRVMQHASFVYDRHTDGTWTVIKDRVNDQYNQILPSDEYLFMMILSAKPSKDWDYDLC